MEANKTAKVRSHYLSCEQFIQKNLISEAFRKRFSGWHSRLPSEIECDQILLEINLNESIDTFDFSFGTTYSSAREFIPNEKAEILDGLINPSSFTGLEFDTGDNFKSIPNLFFFFAPFTEMSSATLASFVCSVLGRKLNYPKFEENISKIFKIKHKINGKFPALGFMLPRNPEIKLSLKFVGNLRDEIERILTQLSLEKKISEILSYLNKFQIPTKENILGFDIGNEINDRICVNFFPEENQWHDVLTQLVSKNMIPNKKVQNCLDWIGQHAAIDSDGNVKVFNRYIRNIKFGFKTNSPTEIKIYLGTTILPQKHSILYNLQSYPIVDLTAER